MLKTLVSALKSFFVWLTQAFIISIPLPSPALRESAQKQKQRRNSARRRRRSSSKALAALNAANAANAESEQGGCCISDFVGIDCEMVGVDRGGRRSALARVSLTKYPSKEVDLSKFSKQHYEIVYDVIVKPSQKVTDFRTRWSGITKDILRDGIVQDGEIIIPVVRFDEARSAVAKLVEGKILIGHDLRSDFSCLNLRHPRSLVRDTSMINQFLLCGRRRKLKHLMEEEFGTCIQAGSSGHDSAEDAASAMALYFKYFKDWEGSLVENNKKVRRPPLLIIDGCNIKYLGLKVLKDSPNEPVKFELTSSGGTIVKGFTQALQQLVKQEIMASVKVLWDGKAVRQEEAFPANKSSDTSLSQGVTLHVTPVDVEADSAIVDETKRVVGRENFSENLGKFPQVDIEEMLRGLESDEPYFFMIKRAWGGKKCHKKVSTPFVFLSPLSETLLLTPRPARLHAFVAQVFDRLNLRRGEGEGASCFCSFLSPRLKLWSIRMTKRMRHEKLSKLVRIVKIPVSYIKIIVCTDDVFLCDRVVKEGGFVLSSSQFAEVL